MKMTMKIKRYLPVCLAAVLIACGAGFAAETQQKEFPYVAQVIGENVNTRAGAGVNHYRCGRLSEPATVVVVAEQFGFAKIRPPKDSFSWIAIQYVDKTDETGGIVNGDSVRVWAGSPYVSAVHSSSSQLELNKGDKVTFAGKPEGDYYKILPPEGAFLWINAAYLKYLGPLSKFVPDGSKEIPVEPIVAPKDAAAPAAPAVPAAPGTPAAPAATAPAVPAAPAAPAATDKPGIEALGTKVAEGQDIRLDKPLSDLTLAPAGQAPVAAPAEDTPAVQPADPVKSAARAKESAAVSKYLELTVKLKEEKAKPLGVQNYDSIEASLNEIIADPESGRAIKFAEVLKDAVERYKTAQLADKSIREQDSELVNKRSEIQKQLKKQLEGLNATTGFVMIGTLTKSFVYTAENGNLKYALKNDDDQIIAYAVPVDAALNEKAEALIGKKVGLNGEVVPDVSTAKVVVNFLDIKEIWDADKK